MKKLIDFLKGEWNSLMYWLMFKREKTKKNKKMSLNEIKLYVINGGTLGVTTFTAIEDWLKIILLVVTIGYTIAKWSKIKDEENK